MFSAVRAVNYNKLIGRLVVAIHSVSRSRGGGGEEGGCRAQHYEALHGGGGARTNTVYLLLVSSKIMIKLYFNVSSIFTESFYNNIVDIIIMISLDIIIRRSLSISIV